MAAKSYQLTLAAAALRLSDVYGDGAGVVNPVNDIPYRQILLTASGADAFVGASTQTVTATVFGIQVDSASPEPASIGPYTSGPVKLSDFYVAGAGSTLHILAIPF